MGALDDVIRNRRSIRKYKPDRIDPATIRGLIDLAVWCPSPFNSQPWNFALLSREYVAGRQASVGEYLFRQTEPALEKVFGKKDLSPLIVKKFLGSFGNAPWLLAVWRGDRIGEVDREFQKAAIYALVQNILLIAHDRGLGACWIGVDEESRVAVRERLDLPPTKGEVMALVTIGLPDQRIRELERKPYSVEVYE